MACIAKVNGQQWNSRESPYNPCSSRAIFRNLCVWDLVEFESDPEGSPLHHDMLRHPKAPVNIPRTPSLEFGQGPEGLPNSDGRYSDDLGEDVNQVSSSKNWVTVLRNVRCSLHSFIDEQT